MSSVQVETAEAVKDALIASLTGTSVDIVRTHRPLWSYEAKLYESNPVLSVTPLNVTIEQESRCSWTWRPTVAVAYAASLEGRLVESDLETHDDVVDSVLSTLAPVQTSPTNNYVSLDLASGGRVVLQAVDPVGINRSVLDRTNSDTFNGLYHWLAEFEYRVKS